MATPHPTSPPADRHDATRRLQQLTDQTKRTRMAAAHVMDPHDPAPQRFETVPTPPAPTVLSFDRQPDADTLPEVGANRLWAVRDEVERKHR